MDYLKQLLGVDNDGLLRWIVMGSVFALVLSIWIMAVVVWRTRNIAREEKIKRRLEMISQPNMGEGRILRLWTDLGEATTIVPGLPTHVTLMAKLGTQLLLAGLDMPAGLFVFAVLGSTMAAGLVTMSLVHSNFVALSAMVAVVMSIWIYFKHRIAKRQVVFETQLIDALELASRSLRAGHPLPGAFRLVAQEIAAPVGTVFSEICQQQDLGVGLDEALRKESELTLSSDLKLFATSVIIQMRSGGSLADMMERLCAVMRDRMRLSRRVRVLTAQTQFSKLILLLMPMVVFVLLNLLNPDYMRPLYTTYDGTRLLAVAAAGLLFGAWLMNRLAIIRY